MPVMNRVGFQKVKPFLRLNLAPKKNSKIQCERGPKTPEY